MGLTQSPERLRAKQSSGGILPQGRGIKPCLRCEQCSKAGPHWLSPGGPLLRRVGPAAHAGLTEGWPSGPLGLGSDPWELVEQRPQLAQNFAACVAVWLREPNLTAGCTRQMRPSELWGIGVTVRGVGSCLSPMTGSCPLLALGCPVDLSRRRKSPGAAGPSLGMPAAQTWGSLSLGF